MTTRRTRVFNNLVLSLTLIAGGGVMYYFDILVPLAIMLMMFGTLPHVRIVELLTMTTHDYEMAPRYARRKTDTPDGWW